MLRRITCIFFVFLSAAAALAIPALTRKYGVECSTCHVHGAKLTAFGQMFKQRGAELSGLESTVGGPPISAWISAISGNRKNDPNREHLFPTRFELVSFDEFARGFRYFVEWFPASWPMGLDGSRSDRSGRFENLYVAANIGRELAIQFGQFRPLTVIDPNRRIAMSEPFALSSSLTGEAGADSRDVALRSFSPTMRSPAARVSWNQFDDPEGGVGSWQAHLTVLFPGEFSLPLSDAAGENAPNEFESRPKGAFVEVVRQTGKGAISGFRFEGNTGRTATGAAFDLELSPWHIEAALWEGEGDGSPKAVRGTFDLIFSRNWVGAWGLRADAIEGQKTWLTPYASFHAGGKGDVWRVAVEARLRNGMSPVFGIELHYLR